jgi:small nuclear ribonucleoprotein (snRNP)-like protein
MAATQGGYEDLLNKRVHITTTSGWNLNGTVVGYCPEPCLIVKDAQGKRVTLAASVIKVLWSAGDA